MVVNEMEYKDFDSKMTSMLEKVGSEASNLILDDVAYLLTDNQKMNDDLKNKNDEIERLKNLNSRLQQVNGNLLLQIPTQKEEKKEADEPKKHSFSWKDVFDEKGNFKN